MDPIRTGRKGLVRSRTEDDFDRETVEQMRELLVAWFELHARKLPWRTDPRDPYAVWVSEVMLQQTRVSTVVPYFQAFLARFPTVTVLAEADQDDVLRSWSGLGYYRRARAMHAAAKQIVAEGRTSMPRDHESLLRLSGIGQYTAAAIASIAYGHPVAVVDGNVLRVLSRLLCDSSPIDSARTRARMQTIAARLLDPGRPGPFNEAMMELGATVCTPRSPSCERCPLQAVCRANRDGSADSLPVTTPRAASPRVKLQAFVLIRGDRVWMCRRRPEGLFGGLWEPPMVPAPARVFRKSLASLTDAKPMRLGTIEHVLTHRVLEVVVVRWEMGRGELAPVDGYDACRWATASQRAKLGLSALASKVLSRAEDISEKG